MDELEQELKKLIVSCLFLEQATAADIDSAEPLFGDRGLGLDSIDALEIGVEIQKVYGVKIDPNDDHLRDHFHTVRSLAQFVASRRAKALP